MSLDIARLRADTPACANLIHFKNAGSSLMPQPVYQATIDHLALEQTIGGYEAAGTADAVLEDFYDASAALLHCDRGEIAYVENATRAWDMAFYSLPLKYGDRILTVEAEYVSNFLGFLQLLGFRSRDDVQVSKRLGQDAGRALAHKRNSKPVQNSRQRLLARCLYPLHNALGGFLPHALQLFQLPCLQVVHIGDASHQVPVH